eukprot:17386-Amphidinium_carterae.1
MGNHMGPVVLPSTSSVWNLSCKKKLEVHGSHRQACGGKTAAVARNARHQKGSSQCFGMRALQSY